ncbi:PepSY-associated TM helix domain-containing protein [Pigmentiphaga aceris]|uniref:PepSY-associated TM helix domain-containing protein n=1 Tax=Pigmentiphaga aceris TaxID=1940612 RepID=UPI0016522E90|nr:PepSY-associated TM helix domain-containing protein [Pigmentiphaga aceris]
MRARLVLLHRWLGLATLAFLILASATGSILAWHDELDAWVAPELLRTPATSVALAPMVPAVLRDIVVAAYPQGRVLAIPLARHPGKTVAFPVWLTDPGSASPVLLEVFIDPATGLIQGDRRWGDPTDGLKNLLPVIHRLHTSLLAGSTGEWVLGVVALLWTLDCFIGAFLTFPARAAKRRAGGPAKSWLARWRAAWALRVSSRGYKLGFDLHRASGLWLWVLLLGMAWSSVAFNLPAVYRPVMGVWLDQQPDLRRALRQSASGSKTSMDWEQALTQGRRHMATMTEEKQLGIVGEHWLAFDPRANLYRYTVRSTQDIRDKTGSTHVFFDAADGKLRGVQLPTGGVAGDTATLWLTSLHMAALWGWPLQLAVSILGIVVVVLSVTGWIIWRRKRQARTTRPVHAAPRAQAAR